MKPVYFCQSHLHIVDEAVNLAEDIASDFFKFSSTDWKAAPYDIRTLKDLAEEEIVSGVFAQVMRYRQDPSKSPSGIGWYEYYKICLHDHEILNALEREKAVALFPLVLYVVTHELVHIARFRRFLHSFYASGEEKAGEEKRVHQITFDILRKVRISGLEPVLKYYQNHCIAHDVKEVRTECLFTNINANPVVRSPKPGRNFPMLP